MGEIEQKTNAAVQTLMDLGLTNCQARIYVTLVLNGSCTADKLSKISKVTRQDIYRILPKLQEIGLAKKILDVPVEWEATSLKEGLALLMDTQKKRYVGLQGQITELLDNFVVSNNKTLNFESGPDFVIIPKGQQQLNWWREKIDKLESSWDGFTVFEGFGQGIHLFEKNFQKALDKGVKFRHLFFTEKEVNHERRKRLLKVSPTFEHINFQERYITATSNYVGMVFDGKEACICTQTICSTRSRKPSTGPFLWSKNEAFVGIIKNYYELLWSQAKEYNKK